MPPGSDRTDRSGEIDRNEGFGTNHVTDLHERLERVRESFRDRCKEHHAQLLDAQGVEDRDRIVRLAHDIAGSAGIFGFSSLTGLARVLEDAARHKDATLNQAVNAVLVELNKIGHRLEI